LRAKKEKKKETDKQEKKTRKRNSNFAHRLYVDRIAIEVHPFGHLQWILVSSLPNGVPLHRGERTVSTATAQTSRPTQAARQAGQTSRPAAQMGASLNKIAQSPDPLTIQCLSHSL